MLDHYLLDSTCFVTSVITEEKWKWSDRQRASLVNTTCDIQKKIQFSLAFKTLWIPWVILFTQYCECPLGSTEEQYSKYGMCGGWVYRCLCGKIYSLIALQNQDIEQTYVY